MRLIRDTVRRTRLARRHALAPGARVASPEAATRAMTVLHATEAPSVYLSCLARVDALTVADVDRALYDDRSLVKQLAMRRTLFVFPRDLLPAAWGSSSARVATALRTRLAKEVVAGGLAADGHAWLAAAEEAVLDHLADGREVSARELRERLPALAGSVDVSPGRTWGGPVPVGPRVLTQLGAEAAIVRGHQGVTRTDPAGAWRAARPQWTTMVAWLGEVPAPWPAEEGYAELVRRWLATFGPGTTADVQWWLGGTLGIVRRALADLGAVEVALEPGPGGADGPATGWVLPGDDADEIEHDGPWAALLPVLDPTVMGWKERGFYLGPHARQLFDTNGNAGTTAWWDGRIVGCWVQDAAGVVHVHLLEEMAPAGREALEHEAARLTVWLDGQRVSTVYPSTAMRTARAATEGDGLG